MTSEIRFVELTTINELTEMQKLEQTVWKMPPIPLHQTLTAIKNGGIALAAYDGKQMVGFNYSFPGFNDGNSYLCSHMLGIHPDYQNQGIGSELKERQKAIAKNRGYLLITWTFDPLEARNATLNLNKLNGILGDYLENNYVDMDDALNRGLPTDRFLVKWWIQETAQLKKAVEELAFDPKGVLAEADIDDEGDPVIVLMKEEPVLDKLIYFVPIPRNFQCIKKSRPDLALDWRIKTRSIFQRLIKNGFIGVKLLNASNEKIFYYIFIKKKNGIREGTPHESTTNGD